jgi:hypothetical protein
MLPREYPDKIRNETFTGWLIFLTLLMVIQGCLLWMDHHLIAKVTLKG